MTEYKPIKTRDYDGVHIYYALTVTGGDTGVFEHVSTWPDQASAQANIAELEAADARRAQLAAEAREAIKAWEDAADGPSDEDEHQAARDVADVLGALLEALRESSLT